MDIRAIKHNDSNFSKNQDVRINFNNSTIESLLHTYYNFGINMNPDYQRDYVWTMEDKLLLIDIILHLNGWNMDMDMKFLTVNSD